MESIQQKFNSDPSKTGHFSTEDPPTPDRSDEPGKREEKLPAPERTPREQPPEVQDPKAVPGKEFDPDYTQQPEIELPDYDPRPKGYAEEPREDIVPEFDNHAKDRGNSAETSGDPASAFAEK